MPYPSCQLCVPKSPNSEFRRKKLKIFFQGQLLSVGIRSLLVAMYWKSSKARILRFLYKSFRGICFLPTTMYWKWKERTFFRYFQRDFFPPSDSHGRKRNHAPLYQLCVPKSPNSEFQGIKSDFFELRESMKLLKRNIIVKPYKLCVVPYC